MLQFSPYITYPLPDVAEMTPLPPPCPLALSLVDAGKAIAPIYEELSQKYPQVKFLKIDIDNQDMQAVVNDHGITGVVSLPAGALC